MGRSLAMRLIGPQRAILLALVVVLAGCGTPRQASGPAEPAVQPAPPPRTLVAALRVEPKFISSKALLQTGFSLQATVALFNAGLAVLDDQGNRHPYLADALPQLNSESWKVAP